MNRSSEPLRKMTVCRTSLKNLGIRYCVLCCKRGEGKGFAYRQNCERYLRKGGKRDQGARESFLAAYLSKEAVRAQDPMTECSDQGPHD